MRPEKAGRCFFSRKCGVSRDLLGAILRWRVTVGDSSTPVVTVERARKRCRAPVHCPKARLDARQVPCASNLFVPYARRRLPPNSANRALHAGPPEGGGVDAHHYQIVEEGAVSAPAQVCASNRGTERMRSFPAEDVGESPPFAPPNGRLGTARRAGKFPPLAQAPTSRRVHIGSAAAKRGAFSPLFFFFYRFFFCLAPGGSAANRRSRAPAFRRGSHPPSASSDGGERTNPPRLKPRKTPESFLCSLDVPLERAAACISPVHVQPGNSLSHRS